MNLLSFFTDPILRAPTLGSMLMCFSAGLIGCLAFLQKRSLIGEALSHAAYPGVVLAVAFTAFLFPFSETGAAISILVGAFTTSILGLLAISGLEKRFKISSDSALCLILSLFFGVGVLISSRLQITHALWLRQIQIFLFGQAATMRDEHIFLYAFLALGMVAVLIILFRYLEILYFDPSFAKTVGMSTGVINSSIYILLVLAIVVGMRSVGVVLMSAMLIAPAVAARQWTNRLATFFILAGLLGMLSGFLGNFFSVQIPLVLGQPIALPTGPMIVLSATAIALFSLAFSPEQGLISRQLRIVRFRVLCHQENVLKALYKKRPVNIPLWLGFLMQAKGWIHGQHLTELGNREAEKLIRLHRLWEVYLVHMGQGLDRVHRSAEEMEHILTPEIEKELELLLLHPTRDPHDQPIPRSPQP